MSLVVEKFIICDNCGENFGIDSMRHGFTLKQIRKAAKQNDWTYIRGKDYCENCIPEKLDTERG